MPRLIPLAISLSLLSSLCLAQETTADEPEPPAVELLTMNGSKPNLSPSGEGITSIKITDLFQRGVTHAKPFDPNFPIELPVGYTLFNKLVYQIDSEAVVSGPDDFVFRIPSATTKESFDKLRILQAERDSADPAKPRWIDVTLVPGLRSYLVDYLTKADFDKRVPDFKTRTLHAFMEHPSSIMVVALKDTTLARDNFVADLTLTGTAPEQVMEGRMVTYDLKVTNNGPDTATGVSLHAQPTFEFVSATASQGTCRMEASNVHCKLANLEKGKSASVTIIEQCRWDSFSSNAPPNYAEGKSIKVESAEVDQNYDNGSLFLLTRIIEDPNKAPVVEITSPKENELFAGPDATISIVAKASDPDGFVNKIEFFDQGVPIGEGALTGEGEYQLIYKKVALGRHWLEVKTTDNLGREARARWFDFFVNGLARVEISDPKTDSLLDRPEEKISVTVHASHPNLNIKEVKVYLRAERSGYGEAKAVPVGNDLYVAKIDCSFCKRRVEFRATAIDNSDIETRSAPVSIKLRKPPVVTLHHYQRREPKEGEEPHEAADMSPLPTNLIFDLSAGATLVSAVEDDLYEDLSIVRLDFFANGKLIDSYVQSGPNHNEIRLIEWDLASFEPGPHKIQMIATDSDGSIGKSEVVEIVVKKRR